MNTLQDRKGLVSVTVILSFIWSGFYLFNWLAQNATAREIFMESMVCTAAAVIIGHEVFTRFTGWKDDRATRPQQTRKANNNN